MNIKNILTRVEQFTPLVPPLQQYVAINPLCDLTQHSFYDVALQYQKLFGVDLFLALTDYHVLLKEEKINRQLFFAELTAHLDALPVSLRASLSQLIQQVDVEALFLWLKKSSTRLNSPHQPDNTIAEQCYAIILKFLAIEDATSLFDYAKTTLGVSPQFAPVQYVEQFMARHKFNEQQASAYLFSVLFYMKGWLGLAKWQKRYAEQPWQLKALSRDEILAVWCLCAEKIQLTHDKPVTQEALSDAQIAMLVIASCAQTAYEKTFATCFISELDASVEHQQVISPATYQWVFCIDTRSQLMRQQLERATRHQTFGFAGFFGLAIHTHSPVLDAEYNQCPILLSPNLFVEVQVAQLNLFADSCQSLTSMTEVLKREQISGFYVYELFGIFYSIAMYARNYLRGLLPQQKKSPTVSLASDIAVTPELIQSLAGMLTSMGLTQFSPYVFICGHASMMQNNPHQSGFDCGACGGCSGILNAHLACQLLNQASVREQLASTMKIHIPETTQFIAACHNTTDDSIELFQPQSMLDSEWRALVKKVQPDLDVARKQCYQQRQALLPLPATANVATQHWAEIAPEYGLINNAAFIIGPRNLSKHLGPEYTTFLHSYDNTLDPHGELLTGIILGPVMVAHWINMQYYLSSVAQDFFGAGDKTCHNLMGNYGVIDGECSDLKFGLTEQSLFYQQQRLHQARRLSVFIAAPLTKVATIFQQHASLVELINGQWLHCYALAQQTFAELRPDHLST